MSYKHVFGVISSEFRDIIHVVMNFMDLLEICSSVTTAKYQKPSTERVP